MTAKPGVCLVTGASYGLGAEISRQLGRAGWTVLLVARSADKLEVLEREICGGEGGGAALGLACDITDTTAVLQLGQKVREKFPAGPDVIINNAAYVPPIHTFATGDVSEWQKAIGVNVMGALLVTRSDSHGLSPPSPLAGFISGPSCPACWRGRAGRSSSSPARPG